MRARGPWAGAMVRGPGPCSGAGQGVEGGASVRPASRHVDAERAARVFVNNVGDADGGYHLNKVGCDAPV